MKRAVVFRREARAEFFEAIGWYEEREAGLGQRFARAIGQTLRRILENPQLGRRMTEEVRRVVLRTFPYTIHYLVEPERVVVMAVFHASRDPAQLRSRY